MLVLSPAAIAAANKINSEDPWLPLLEIILPNDPDHIYLVRNNEDILWNGQTWQAFPFDITETKSDDKGTLASLSIEVDNTSRDLEYYLQRGQGGTDGRVIFRCVCAASLDSTEPDFEEYYSVKSTTVTEKVIRFTLGSAYPTQSRRPWGRYMKNSCPFKYKGLKCAATSELESCNHTLKDCRERNNSKRFGGFTGIPQGGLYL